MKAMHACLLSSQADGVLVSFVMLRPCNPVGRFLLERDPSVAPSTLSVQLAYQCNLLVLPSLEEDEHSMRIKAALHLFYL